MEYSQQVLGVGCQQPALGLGQSSHFDQCLKDHVDCLAGGWDAHYLSCHLSLLEELFRQLYAVLLDLSAKHSDGTAAYHPHRNIVPLGNSDKDCS